MSFITFTGARFDEGTGEITFSYQNKFSLGKEQLGSPKEVSLRIAGRGQPDRAAALDLAGLLLPWEQAGKITEEKINRLGIETAQTFKELGVTGPCLKMMGGTFKQVEALSTSESSINYWQKFNQILKVVTDCYSRPKDWLLDFEKRSKFKTGS